MIKIAYSVLGDTLRIRAISVESADSIRWRCTNARTASGPH
jgi:hypothetical protein